MIDLPALLYEVQIDTYTIFTELLKNLLILIFLNIPNLFLNALYHCIELMEIVKNAI